MRVESYMRKLLTVLLLLTFAVASCAAIPPAENLLPADTLFFITIPDFAALRADAKQSPGWLFWNDPAMQPFRDKFIAKWQATIVAPLEQDLGVKLSDFANLPRGQLTFAVTQNGWTGGDDPSPGVLLLLDAKDKSGLLKTNLAALTKKWKDDGKPIHTETIRGIPFSIVPLASNDIPDALSGLLPRHQPVQELGESPPSEEPGELVVGQVDSLLIVGNSPKAVEPVVAHLTGSLLPALSDDSVFAADKLSQFRNGPLYFGWLNAKTLFDVLSHIPPPPPNPDAPTVFPQPQWDKIFTALGLTGVKSISFAYRETHDGSQANLFVAVPKPDRQGLFKMFAAEAKSAVPPPFVPADAVKFWRWRLDGQDAWATLQKMVGDISPAALSGLNAAIDMANANGQQKDPNFDIRKNLIENLGDDFVSYQKSPTGTTVADLNNVPSLFLFSVQNSDRAVAAINGLFSLMPGADKVPDPRNFLGHKIFTLPLPGPRVPGATAAARSLYCTTSGGYVALTTDISVLEAFLRGTQTPPKPLNGMPGLIDAAQHVGGAGTGLFGYENQGETMRILFKLLKNQAASGSGGGPTAFALIPPSIRDWADFSLLPDYDQVSKYFYFSVYSGSATADGLSFKAFAPRPPGLN